MSAALDQVLSLVERAKRNGTGYMARCPAHEDRNPSLSISEGEDGRVLLHCHAGCQTAAILGVLGLTEGDLFDRNGSAPPEIVATYPYVDENGELLFEVCRRSDKQFPQRRPDGAGDWIWNTRGVRRVLYRLPAVIQAVGSSERVWIVEGEKDVEALERAGVVATCNPGGAGKWHLVDAEPLRGAHVRIVPDRDAAGYAHARQVVASLQGVARSIEIRLPAEGKDASDHLAAGRKLRDFEPITLADLDGDEPEPPLASAEESTGEPYVALDLDTVLAAPPEEPDWDWRGYYARGDVGLEAGDPGVGKSMNALARTVLAGTGGGEHLGEPIASRRSLFFDLESPDDVVYQRLHARGLRGSIDGFTYVHRPAGFNLLDELERDRVRATIVEHRAELVVIDSLRRAAPALDENDSRQVSIVLSALRDLAAELDVSIILIHHPRKPVGDTKVEALYAARGSGDLIGSVDSYLFYRKLSGGLVRIEHAKARRGREHAPVHYRIVEGDDGSPQIEHVEVEHGLDDEAAQALLEEVVEYVREHPGASQKDVREGVKGNATAIDRALERALGVGTSDSGGPALVLGPGRAWNGKYFYPSDHALFSSSDEPGRAGTTGVSSSPSDFGRPARPAPVGADDQKDEPASATSDLASADMMRAREGTP